MKKKQLLLTAVASVAVPAMAFVALDRNALTGNVTVRGESFSHPPTAAETKAAGTARHDSIVAAERAARTLTKAPRRAPSGTALPAIVASVYDYASGSIGMYHLPEVSGGEMEKISDVSSYYGGTLVGNLYYACHDGRFDDYWDTDNDPHGHKIQAYDINTWQPVGNELNLPLYRASDLAVNPADGKGYAYVDVGSMTYQFYTIDLQTGEESDMGIQSFAFQEEPRALAFREDGTLYGVNRGGEFGPVDMTTAKIVPVTTLSLPRADLQHGWTGSFDPDSGNFIFIYNGSEDWGTTHQSYVYSIDPATGESTLLGEFAGKCITSMYIAPENVVPGAPAEVTDLSADFADGSLSGTLNFTMPSTLHDGSAADGTATWTVYDGKDAVASGQAVYGAHVSSAVTVATAGRHNFSVTASNASGEGRKVRLSVWAGPDRPLPPTNVNVDYDDSDNTFAVTWDAVTKGANSGFVDPAAITYTVTRMPGDMVVAENITETAFTDVYEPEGIESVTYSVTARQGDAVSDPATSIPVLTGFMTLPYDLAQADMYNLLENWTIVDANGDGSTWDADSYYKIYYKYNSANAADDWAFTPPIKSFAGCKYNVHAVFKSQSSSFTERIEVKAGYAPAPEAMTITALAPTDIADSDNGVAVDFTVVPDADGKLFIGFHALSDADRYYLKMVELTISAPVNEAAPAAPVIKEVTADRTGALTAAGSVAVPARAENGTSLGAVSRLEVLRNGVVVATFENPEPGGTVLFTDDALTDDAECEYVAYAYNDDLRSSPSAAVRTFVGVNRPGSVTGITICRLADDPKKVAVTWDAAAVDWQNYPLNGNVTYNLEVYPDNAYYHGNKTYEGIDGTSFTFEPTYETGRDHGFVAVKISAVNDKGVGYAEKSRNIYCGAPLPLPFRESFPDYSLEHPWGDGESNGPQIASITDDERSLALQQYNGWNRLMDSSSAAGSQDGDNGFAGMFGWSYVNDDQGNYHNEYTELLSPAIDLSGVDRPMLSFYTYNWLQNGFADPNILDVDVVTEEGVRCNALHLVISDLGDVEAWERVSVDLGEFSGQTVSFIFKGTIISNGENGYNWVLIDNISIDRMPGIDLSVSDISAPVTAVPNEPFAVKARVTNVGGTDVASHTARLYHNGEEVASKNLGSLAFGKSSTVEFGHALSVQDPVGNVFKIEIVADGDENTANNVTSEVTVARNLQLLPEPREVFINPGGKRLEWNAPDMDSAVPAAFTEDFESYPVYEQEQFLTEAGDWIFIDRDGHPIGGMMSSSTWEMMEFPGIPVHSAQSWWVQSRLFEEFNDGYYGHDNSLQYLANMYVVNDTFTAGERQDDWAISPELCGREQLVTLWARSYNRDTPESVEFLYSDGGTDPGSFTLIRRVDELPGDWTQYALVLPEGARRLAIRGCSYAPMGTAQTFVDNVTFYPASGEAQNLELIGYNVYCDNVRVNASPVAQFEYLDLPGEDHIYAVSSVYASGESRAVKAQVGNGIDSMTVSGLRVSVEGGTITLSGLDGLRYSVVSASGIVYGAGSGVADARIDVCRGVCVVSVGPKVFRIVVK